MNDAWTNAIEVNMTRLPKLAYSNNRSHVRHSTLLDLVSPFAMEFPLYAASGDDGCYHSYSKALEKGMIRLYL